jgi:AcrR family transcriptional regulator
VQAFNVQNKYKRDIIMIDKLSKMKGEDMRVVKAKTSDIIISTAKKLFIENSISKITIEDIAVAANVGEATIYRYFGNKQSLVLEVAIKLSTDVYDNYFRFEKNLSGLEMITQFYNSYLNIYVENKKYYVFISELDNILIHEHLDVLVYEKMINRFKEIFDMAYELGVKNKTVRKIENIDLFYYTSTQAILSLCKKLAISDGILESDHRFKSVEEIKMIIDVYLSYLSTK